MLTVAGNIEVEIRNADKTIVYRRRFDINQWYVRVLNYSINPYVRGGWRIRSLTLGMEDMELLKEADNYVDVILLLDFFDKGPARYAELSFFVDGTWPKTIGYPPRNEVIHRYPADGFFRAICPFPL